MYQPATRTHQVDAHGVADARVDEGLRRECGVAGGDHHQLQVVLPRGAEVPQGVHRHELQAAAAVLEPVGGRGVGLRWIEKGGRVTGVGHV